MKIRKLKKAIKKALNKNNPLIEDWVVFKKYCYSNNKFINSLFNKYNLCLRDCDFNFKNIVHFRAEALTKIENNKILYIGVEECKTKRYNLNYYIFCFIKN